ncbi:hypothetical protein B0H17DRAFT_1182746 [Mycena rosella]|uniref:Uncharacterized protein n=1 Tax=Mycena rosella TaxID=1033263 RepID=A0AAD7D3I2_MYCRO|nr:hypothetical protein B0H17DRAFT_1182746 [Mycena rosella]
MTFDGRAGGRTPSATRLLLALLINVGPAHQAPGNSRQCVMPEDLAHVSPDISNVPLVLPSSLGGGNFKTPVGNSAGRKAKTGKQSAARDESILLTSKPVPNVSVACCCPNPGNGHTYTNASNDNDIGPIVDGSRNFRPEPYTSQPVVPYLHLFTLLLHNTSYEYEYKYEYEYGYEYTQKCTLCETPSHSSTNLRASDLRHLAILRSFLDEKFGRGSRLAAMYLAVSELATRAVNEGRPSEHEAEWITPAEGI